MTPNRADHDEQEARLAQLGGLAGAHIDGDQPVVDEQAARRRFSENLAREASRETTGRLTARQRKAIGLACAAAAIAAFGARVLSQRPLSYQVDTTAFGERNYVQVPASAPSAHVHFSDGSEIAFAPGGRGRIEALHSDGAEISLEEGSASVDVIHRERTHWSVGAGPFLVMVTGTSFDVSWTGSTELFEVVMRTGTVTVRGPLAPSGIEVEAGHRLVADLRAGHLRIETSEAKGAKPPASPPAPSEAPTPSDDARDQSPGSLDTTGRGHQGTSPEAAKQSWSKRVAAGDFAGVMAEAQQRGVDATLTQSPLADLVALSDAARYVGRSDVASRALLAERDRFAGSAAARTAAFLLGRLADGSDRAAAVRWYDRYLAESPSGEFASEALGRKMLSIRSSSGDRAARPLAQDYLQRFPKGAYAAAARELTLAP